MLINVDQRMLLIDIKTKTNSVDEQVVGRMKEQELYLLTQIKVSYKIVFSHITFYCYYFIVV